MKTGSKTREKVKNFLNSRRTLAKELEKKYLRNDATEIHTGEIYRQEHQNKSVAKLRKRLHKQYKLAPLLANSTFYVKDECPIKTVEIQRRLNMDKNNVEPEEKSYKNNTYFPGNFLYQGKRKIVSKKDITLLKSRYNQRRSFERGGIKNGLKTSLSKLKEKLEEKKVYTKIFSSFSHSNQNSIGSTSNRTQK
mmetsp:Transcript_6957/g.6132  ORF Transcript_6957/g.6132 Transcript_6957/m.6132 type:complete len:193 (-) Transcript_6957:498-1076(-)